MNQENSCYKSISVALEDKELVADLVDLIRMSTGYLDLTIDVDDDGGAVLGLGSLVDDIEDNYPYEVSVQYTIGAYDKSLLEKKAIESIKIDKEEELAF